MNAPFHVAGLGHNNPPTPFDLSTTEVNDLIMEGANWLDGAPVTSAAEAEAVATLLDMFRQAEKRIDARRKAEAEPHDKAKAEIQARYNLLIGDTKSTRGAIPLALDACKRALAPWLLAEELRKRREAEEARKVAQEAAERARQAFQVAPVTDLAARIDAERLASDAKQAEAIAKDAENDKASARGGSRAVTLRTIHRAEVTDRRAFLNWVAANRPDELTGMLQSFAERLCSASVRSLPGVTYTEEQRAQ